MRLTRKILHRTCRPAVFDNTNRNHWLAQEMTEFMIKQGGIGMAANQIGLDLRLFVMKVDDRTRFCFNPEIIWTGSLEIKKAEGCLSFANKQCTIARPDQIEVRYQDHKGCWIQEKLSGLASRCYQHELDHVNGITMWHRENEQTTKQ